MPRYTAAERRRMNVQRIIHETGLPRALVARLAGVNEATVWSWLRPGGAAARAPSAESVQRLAAGLREYAARLARLADQLNGSTEEP